MANYLGIVIEQSFQDPTVLQHFSVVVRRPGGWNFLLVEVAEADLADLIARMQAAMHRDDKWYAHFFRGHELVVVYHDAVFLVRTDPSTWQPAVEHGLASGIPLEQLDFTPRTVEGAIQFFSLQPTPADWDVADPAALAVDWQGEHCLGFANQLLLLKREPWYRAFTLEADLALAADGYIGLVFGAQNRANHELVYIYHGEGQPGWVQYDPVMNGSNTWQIYNGERYISPHVSVPAGEWVHLALQVAGGQVAITAGDAAEPQLVVPLMLGATGKVGLWNFGGQAYVRNLRLVPLVEPPTSAASPAPVRPAGLAMRWQVAPTPNGPWRDAPVEENGVLNLNRHFEPGVAYARTTVQSDAACTAQLSLGFSDQVRLQVNGEQVYQGEWHWEPPATDGRIRLDYATVPVSLRAGANTILAEVTHDEPPFGWGLTVAVKPSGRS
ncbi:MAG: hypothetical protein ACM3XM_08250 [Mycobacterium leprae]